MSLQCYFSANLKFSEMPFGQLPSLEVDGKILSQSMAINRYLAKKFKLTGKDDWEAAECDSLADGWGDVMPHMRALYMESDAEKKKALAEQISKDHIEPFLGRYEKFLADNGGNFFVGNQLTWVDLLFAHIFRMLEDKFPNAVAKHKNSIEFASKIEAIPTIKKWIETRPKTEM